jgi:transcriptional regulator with XRE-family HTH domain
MRTLLARLISAWIKAHGHPLKCVAGRIGVAESTICQWARGKRFPSPDNLDDLARCAGVPTICLLCPCLVQAYEQVALARERSGTLHAGSNTPIAER